VCVYVYIHIFKEKTNYLYQVYITWHERPCYYKTFCQPLFKIIR